MTDTVTLTRAEAKPLAAAASLGLALAGWIATTAQLGHASPGSTLDYDHSVEGSDNAFVRDFVAWTSGRKDMAHGCEDRLREWGLVEAKSRMEAVGRQIDPVFT